ncbi:hypothetical protein [Actinophytocola xanthii]|uniref:Uncharacterized protein n=1 Tax=Actinophytocola xanthii TaxID=1912961 RepID=A0A1Q8CNR1_9PSEU|nr:hypothetical protein [Actinophytocola xanthii]OLF16004.1 hypothetical protein BU204_19095 [Actinophytocola xanthii]
MADNPFSRNPSGRWAHRRPSLGMFAAVPAAIILVGGVAVLPDNLQLVALRAALLLVVCLLPAVLWYLFITTRRASLLNEFLANLDRLGLMDRQTGESEVPKRRRISGYLQRFGAAYGDLPEKVHETVQGNRFARYTRSDFDSSTGTTTAAIPVLTSTVLISIGWLLTLPPIHVGAPPSDGPESAVAVVAWFHALTPELQPVTLAFVGAYFFSLQMLFRRYALKDLRGSAYIAVSIRVILAIIGTWVLTVVNQETKLLDPAVLATVSFTLGVFPLVLWQLITQHLKRQTYLTVPGMRTPLSLDQLDGLTVWHQARLEEEDIENIPNMATADLVDLLLNTRLAPNRIIDWTDQAILYTHLGPTARDGASGERHEKRERLHALGIRTATAFLRVAEANRDARWFATLLDEGGHRKVTATLETALRANANLRLVQCWRRPCEPAAAPEPERPSEPIVLSVPIAPAVPGGR